MVLSNWTSQELSVLRKNHLPAFCHHWGVFFWMSCGCGGRCTVCPSHWIQTAELECEGWNHMSESKVPAEKHSEHNIWLDEVIKSASWPKILQCDCSWILWGSNGGMANRKGTWILDLRYTGQLSVFWLPLSPISNTPPCPLTQGQMWSTYTNKGCTRMLREACFSWWDKIQIYRIICSL